MVDMYDKYLPNQEDLDRKLPLRKWLGRKSREVQRRALKAKQAQQAHEAEMLEKSSGIPTALRKKYIVN